MQTLLCCTRFLSVFQIFRRRRALELRPRSALLLSTELLHSPLRATLKALSNMPRRAAYVLGILHFAGGIQGSAHSAQHSQQPFDAASCARTLQTALSPICAEHALYRPTATFNCTHLRALAMQPEAHIASLGRRWRVYDAPLVFGVGFGDTGTRSLQCSLNGLHVRSEHNTPQELLQAVQRHDFGHILGRAQAYTDDPIAGLWKILFAAFPHARFVLTTRSDYHRDSGYACITSSTGTRVWHREKERLGQCLQYGRGCPENRQENVLLEREHTARVIADVPPERLLVMNLSDGSFSRGRLARFLNRSYILEGIGKWPCNS